MYTEPELLNERLERLAIMLDEIMPNCALLVRDALELLKEQEAVVLCKDCRYYDPKYVDEECRLLHNFTTEPDWFCADGERRTDDS